jgi:Tfp pilus assembly protein PilN
MTLSPSWISAIASVASLVLVAVSAVAALRQITHIRLANQSETLLAIVGLMQQPKIHEIIQFVHEGQLDAICDDLGDAPALVDVQRALTTFMPLLNACETVGGCVVYKMIDARVVFGMFLPSSIWHGSERFIRLYRRVSGVETFLDKFEALVAMSEHYTETELPKMPVTPTKKATP